MRISTIDGADVVWRIHHPLAAISASQSLDRPARGDPDHVDPAVSSRSDEPVALVHGRR